MCSLQRSLYGLKQAGHVWNKKFDQVLKQMRFQQSKNDPCLYVRRNGAHYTYLVIYVDDMVIACNDEEEYEEIIKTLNRNFKVTSLGDISHFLGIKIKRNEKGFSLNQQTYIQQVLERFGMDQAQPSK